MPRAHGPIDDGGREENATSELERRRGERREVALVARVIPDTPGITGQVRDASRSGLFVELDRELLVEVEYQDHGRAERRTARLVRCQRMPGGHSGWALEFVEPPPPPPATPLRVPATLPTPPQGPR